MVSIAEKTCCKSEKPGGKLDAAQVDAALKALASEQRREILHMLADCGCTGDSCDISLDVCACRITERLGLAPSTVSHHMSLLVAAGLVSARKKGTWVHYRLRREAFRQVAEELLRF